MRVPLFHPGITTEGFPGHCWALVLSSSTFINIEQQFFPGGNLNENFVAELEQVIIKDSPNKERHVVFLCRSGARSARAATLMAQYGWINCYNIASGFEGDPDEYHHRASVNGWKFEGLPWIQQ